MLISSVVSGSSPLLSSLVPMSFSFIIKYLVFLVKRCLACFVLSNCFIYPSKELALHFELPFDVQNLAIS